MAPWQLVFDGYDAQDEGRREALCCLGNGYFATRGAAPESAADGVHYPGTYVAGVYNRLVSDVAGRTVENESLVNVPNWLVLTFRPEGGRWCDGSTEVLSHHQSLDLYRGVLTRRSRLRLDGDRVLQVTQRRFVSMRDPHIGALETTLVAEGWAGLLEVRSAIDGRVTNSGVERYRAFDATHLRPVASGADGDDVVWLVTETTQSCVRIAQAVRTTVQQQGAPVPVAGAVIDEEGYVAQDFLVDLQAGEEVIVEKIATLFTSRDAAIAEPGLEARTWASRVAGGFDELLQRHALSWRHIWGRGRIDMGSDADIASVMRLNMFHVLQTVSNNSLFLDVGVPARGLHGEAYRGHVFWDAMFVLPFLNLRFPQLSRALLLYRYRRLDQARQSATEAGYRGAMFPWQSASTGREETPTVHLNPRSGRWPHDASHLQRHVNASIAYDIWQYYQATSDAEFLRLFGAEMLLEIARFWSSMATYNHALDRYEIKGVMGPDEYHEGYADRAEPGLDNNAYTNVMAVWCLCRAFDTLRMVPPVLAGDLRERLALHEDELARWDQVSRRMRVCFHDGVISQFEGYESLKELDWEAYRARYGDISRLDRILEAEGDSPDKYKVSKQPDVTMLFYLFSSSELVGLFERMGYNFDPATIPRNIDYYSARSSHGSTLSRVVDAWIDARRDRQGGWQLFLEAAKQDLNLHGGTTAEGVHLGAMGGTIDLAQRCYTGLELRGEVLHLSPLIPEAVGTVAFDIRYRGHLLHLTFTRHEATVAVDQAEGAPITVDVNGRVERVGPGQAVEFSLDG